VSELAAGDETVEPRRRGLLGWLARLEDGAIIRFAFFAMLAGTLSVLYIDYSELSQADVAPGVTPLMPVLPAFDPDSPAAEPGPEVTTDRDLLRAPLTVELRNDGVLAVTGTIDIGASTRFAEEVEKRGSYVKTVALDSPGGSVEDALAMGKLIREKGFDTSVAAGAICASSCPLVFVAGTNRFATEQSVIGVHQIYAAAPTDALSGLRAAGTAMSDAQKTTARITRYLQEMGVDSTIWLNALETPPDRLYYFSPKEFTDLRIVTELTK
jgi:hypothetical protein